MNGLPEANSATTSYEKLRQSVRYWLLGREYHTALRAMNFAEEYHIGFRKDGAPEFSHQVWQVAFARTLAPSLIYPEATLATIFLHDTVEDYPVTIEMIENLCGPMIAHSVDLMSKVIGGVKKPPEQYFLEMSKDPIASIAKGVDRAHNHKTMKGAFTAPKQRDQIAETEDSILPMFKAARRLFPQQELAYENIKHMLVSQVDLYRYNLEAQAA